MSLAQECLHIFACLRHALAIADPNQNRGDRPQLCLIAAQHPPASVQRNNKRIILILPGGGLAFLGKHSDYSERHVLDPDLVADRIEAREPTLRLTYLGIPRHAEQQQIEFCLVAVVRISRALSGRQLFPKHVSMIHVRSKGSSRFARFLGGDIEFGGNADEIVFPAGSADWALVDADRRLNKILLKTCEESLDARNSKRGSVRIKVENTIAPLLPHGQAHADVVAKKLGMSERTLARRLAEENVSFTEVLQQLKESLAIRYLEDDGMPISRIAWLLGFEEVSSFSHACRRWTDKSPRELRRLS
jgi:AraC-like DNA-binding protein